MRRALLLLLAGCAEDVPVTPTYQADIKPILEARCVRCHGYPQISATPESFRLDMFEQRTVAIPNALFLDGVKIQADSIKARVTGRDADGASIATMPPRFPLTDSQVDTIARWVDQGAERGAPRPGNHAPSLVATATIVDGAPSFDYTLTDADGELVTGVIVGRAFGIDTPILEISSGRGVGVRPPVAIPSGAYALSALLDDGTDTVVPLGDLVVP